MKNVIFNINQIHNPSNVDQLNLQARMYFSFCVMHSIYFSVYANKALSDT